MTREGATCVASFPPACCCGMGTSSTRENACHGPVPFLDGCLHLRCLLTRLQKAKRWLDGCSPAFGECCSVHAVLVPPASRPPHQPQFEIQVSNTDGQQGTGDHRGLLTVRHRTYFHAKLIPLKVI